MPTAQAERFRPLSRGLINGAPFLLRFGRAVVVSCVEFLLTPESGHPTVCESTGQSTRTEGFKMRQPFCEETYRDALLWTVDECSSFSAVDSLVVACELRAARYASIDR